MVAPECAPAAKAGGLGDVVSGLSRELELRGHAVEIVLPKYASMRYPDIWDLQPSYRDLWVPWAWASASDHLSAASLCSEPSTPNRRRRTGEVVSLGDRATRAAACSGRRR